MLKLSCSYDSVRFLLMKNELNGLKAVTFCVSFQFLTLFYTIVGAGAVGAGAASGSDQMMRLRFHRHDIIIVSHKMDCMKLL
jgi:hypothetical protein